MNLKDGYYSLQCEYTSDLDDEFNKKISVSIMKESDNQINKIKIGSFTLNIILYWEAVEAGCDFVEFFADSSFLNIGEEIFDFDTNELVKPIADFYDNQVNGNYCIIEDFEISKEYLDATLLSKIFKKIISLHSIECCLFIIENKKLKIKSKSKLLYSFETFLNLLGFENIPKISKKLMFFNTAFQKDYTVLE